MFKLPERQSQDINAKSLIKHFLQYCNESFFYQSKHSTFYRDHLPLLFTYAEADLQNQLSQRLNHLRIIISNIKNVTLERLKQYIVLEVKNPTGIFKSVIQLWSSYCRCKVKFYESKDIIELSNSLKQILKQQIRIFSQFIFRMCEYVFEQLFISYKSTLKNKNHQIDDLFILQQISIALTSNVYFQQIYLDIADILTSNKIKWQLKDYRQTQNQLKKFLNIELEEYFCNSIDAINKFCVEPQFNKKVEKLIKFQQAIISDIKKAAIKQFEQSEDIIANLYAYLFLNSKKNVHGACIYLQIILTSNVLQQVKQQLHISNYFQKISQVGFQKLFLSVKHYSNITISQQANHHA